VEAISKDAIKKDDYSSATFVRRKHLGDSKGLALEDNRHEATMQLKRAGQMSKIVLPIQRKSNINSNGGVLQMKRHQWDGSNWIVVDPSVSTADKGPPTMPGSFIGQYYDEATQVYSDPAVFTASDVPDESQLHSLPTARYNMRTSSSARKRASDVFGTQYDDAKPGTSTTKSYGKTFFDAYGPSAGAVKFNRAKDGAAYKKEELPRHVVGNVHHAMEQSAVTKRYPGIISLEELHSLLNLRGIPKQINNYMHLSQIRLIWNEFYKANPVDVKKLNSAQKAKFRREWINYAMRIDSTYGQMFFPPLYEEL